MLVLRVFEAKHTRTVQKRDGTTFDVNFQEAEILRGNRRPRVVEIPTSREGAYAEGLYTVDGSGFRPDDFDRLSLNQYFRLQSLNDALKSAQQMSDAKAPGQKRNN